MGVVLAALFDFVRYRFAQSPAFEVMRLRAAWIFFGSLATRSACSLAQLSNWLSHCLAFCPFSPLKGSGLLMTSLERPACRALVSPVRRLVSCALSILDGVVV